MRVICRSVKNEHNQYEIKLERATPQSDPAATIAIETVRPAVAGEFFVDRLYEVAFTLLPDEVPPP